MKKSEIDRNYTEAWKSYSIALEMWEDRRTAAETGEIGFDAVGPRPTAPKRVGTPDQCEVDDCRKPPVSRGYCHYHYSRWRSGSDPTEPPKAPGRPAAWNGKETRIVNVPLRQDVIDALADLARAQRTSRADVHNRVLALALDLPEYLEGDPRAPR